MASDLRLRVGNTTATITFGGTDQQVANALRRFATSLGISLEGTPTENLEAILLHFKDDVKTRAKEVHARELRQANEESIRNAVESEGSI